MVYVDSVRDHDWCIISCDFGKYNPPHSSSTEHSDTRVPSSPSDSTGTSTLPGDKPSQDAEYTSGRNGGHAGSGSVPTGTIAITESGTRATGGAGGHGGNGGEGGSGSIPGQGGAGGSRRTGGEGSYLEFDRVWPLSTLTWYGDKGADGVAGTIGSDGSVRT